MSSTTATGYWRRRYALAYQDAGADDPDTAPVMKRCFRTEDEARAWAEVSPVIPLGIDEVDERVGPTGRVEDTITRIIEY